MNWNILNQPLGQCDLSGGYAPSKKRIWPAIIMAAAAIGSAVYSGAQSSKANREAQEELDQQKALTGNKRRRKVNEQYLDTAAGQNLIRTANVEADKIYNKEAGNAAMTGATERVAMAKQYGNDMVGNAIANIAANDSERRDRIDENYENYERSLRQQQIELDRQQALNDAQAGAQLISGLGSAAASYAGTYSGSPGGSGVTAGKATNQLQNMGGGSKPNLYNMTPDMQRQWAMQNYGTLFGSAPKYHPAQK